MSLALVVLVGVLFASGTYLMMHRTATRIVLGVAMLGNGVNLLILVVGGPAGDAPIIGRAGPFADPLPQALVLTAIVIGFAMQAFLLALAWRSWTIDDNDEVEDDLEDRRLAREARQASDAAEQALADDQEAADRLATASPATASLATEPPAQDHRARDRGEHL